MHTSLAFAWSTFLVITWGRSCTCWWSVQGLFSINWRCSWGSSIYTRISWVTCSPLQPTKRYCQRCNRRSSTSWRRFWGHVAACSSSCCWSGFLSRWSHWARLGVGISYARLRYYFRAFWLCSRSASFFASPAHIFLDHRLFACMQWRMRQHIGWTKRTYLYPYSCWASCGTSLCSWPRSWCSTLSSPRLS